MVDSRTEALAKEIKDEAKRLGFALAGITSADPPAHLEVYAGWLAAGRQGDMQYLESERARQRRADPHQILPGCRSILVLGVRYPAAGSSVSGDDATGLRGRVAAYAWGDDYHKVLPERLQALVGFIEAAAGKPVPSRWYTDTGPLLERELAQRAGLGWIGKNTCLINPAQGSYFLLAEILLGIDLPPDEPFLPDRCGSCTRCIDACPTTCILPDRTIDARRCISYLTIEKQGAIAPDLRPLLQDWVFGCDICQQVCPWNQRFGTAEGDPAFAPRPELPAPALIPELQLDPQAFSQKFKDSPLKRTRRGGYLRNVALALGNQGDPAAIPALRRALLEDPEPLVRGHAAWALGQIGGEAAEAALHLAVRHEKDSEVLDEIDRSLSDRS